jgi:hypothetical protein
LVLSGDEETSEARDGLAEALEAPGVGIGTVGLLEDTPLLFVGAAWPNTGGPLLVPNAKLMPVDTVLLVSATLLLVGAASLFTSAPPLPVAAALAFGWLKNEKAPGAAPNVRVELELGAGVGVEVCGEGWLDRARLLLPEPPSDEGSSEGFRLLPATGGRGGKVSSSTSKPISARLCR